ncbi:AraC-type DNA-binding protein [Verrucomicrobium sp. GAS474]|uniref:helix-turn-helix domain-containing protein n=1 Tax=Verrucomicrobium sp. GAS474 TaxID=1882831 RepID=UPI00087C1E5D|nr:AraC family transcriptional regulator [Verrucomicrobium sp. GAS474]SDU30580.1 AraC-type DNA-binding protein [Verrucomicrobium sp. GAS474]
MKKDRQARQSGARSKAMPSPVSSVIPAFPFREIEIVGLGGRMHGPTSHPWVWETTTPHFNFWFLIQGEGRLRYRKRDWVLEPGTCFLFPPGSRISGGPAPHSREPVLNFSVHFFPRPRQPVPEDALARLSGRKVHRMAFFLELALHATDAYKRGDAHGLRQTELAALQMLHHLWREASSPPPRKQDDRILQFLAEAGRKGGTDVPRLAKRVGLSPSQLTRRVKVLTGMAPAAYLIRERISHACSLLTETAQSVNEVAEALGYSDPSYFVRQFQEVMKSTPARFRRKALSEGRA